MNNSLIIAIGIVLILTAGFLGAGDHLRRQWKALQTIQKALKKAVDTRRDTIPYLIESYRRRLEKPEAAMQKKIQHLIDEREKSRELSFKVAKDPREFYSFWAVEKKLESHLLEFFKAADHSAPHSEALQKDIGWLEAKTEIQKIHAEIVEAEHQHNAYSRYLNRRMGQFPFSLFEKKLSNKLISKISNFKA